MIQIDLQTLVIYPFMYFLFVMISNLSDKPKSFYINLKPILRIIYKNTYVYFLIYRNTFYLGQNCLILCTYPKETKYQ